VPVATSASLPPEGSAADVDGIITNLKHHSQRKVIGCAGCRWQPSCIGTTPSQLVLVELSPWTIDKPHHVIYCLVNFQLQGKYSVSSETRSLLAACQDAVLALPRQPGRNMADERDDFPGQ
jgi:hypothetical protein